MVPLNKAGYQDFLGGGSEAGAAAAIARVATRAELMNVTNELEKRRNPYERLLEGGMKGIHQNADQGFIQGTVGNFIVVRHERHLRGAPRDLSIWHRSRKRIKNWGSAPFNPAKEASSAGTSACACA